MSIGSLFVKMDCSKMLTIGEVKCGVCGNSIYYYWIFSVNVTLSKIKRLFK